MLWFCFAVFTENRSKVRTGLRRSKWSFSKIILFEKISSTKPIRPSGLERSSAGKRSKLNVGQRKRPKDAAPRCAEHVVRLLVRLLFRMAGAVPSCWPLRIAVHRTLAFSPYDQNGCERLSAQSSCILGICSANFKLKLWWPNAARAANKTHRSKSKAIKPLHQNHIEHPGSGASF